MMDGVMDNLMTDVYEFPYTAIGDTLDRTTAYQIFGIRVDNYSRRWLWVDTVKRFVPPLHTGWQASVLPSARSVRIEYVAPPVGALPIPLVGEGYARVRVSAFTLPDSEGIGFGQTPNSPLSGAVNVATSNVSVDETVLIAGIPGQFLTILSWVVWSDIDFVGFLQVEFEIDQPWLNIDGCILTPSNPCARAVYPDGYFVVTPAGKGLRIHVVHHTTFDLDTIIRHKFVPA